MTLPPLQALYFDEPSVGMTETYSKTVKSSDVVGFAEITGDRNPIPPVGALCGKDSVQGPDRSRPLYR